MIKEHIISLSLFLAINIGVTSLCIYFFYRITKFEKKIIALYKLFYTIKENINELKEIINREDK